MNLLIRQRVRFQMHSQNHFLIISSLEDGAYFSLCNNLSSKALLFFLNNCLQRFCSDFINLKTSY